MGRHRHRSSRGSRSSRRRSRSRSRSDSSGSRSREKRRAERKRREEDRKRKEEEKKRLKASETPEERRRRRLAKKAEKEKVRKEDNEICGYTNEDNPFGDSRLTQRLVWKKRDTVREQKGMEVQDYGKKRERERRKEIEYEVQKVKRRREERAEERRLMDEERTRMQRMRDAAENQDWHRQEREFHLNMSKMRTAIRVREGRERPIDTLSKNLGLHNPDNPEEEMEVDLDLAEPYKVFTDLYRDELEEVVKDIKEKIALGDEHAAYWQALLDVGEDALQTMKEEDENVRSHTKVVLGEMQKVFAGKTLPQLITLQEGIEDRLENDPNIDHAYWQVALQKLRVHQAKARLRDMHAELLGARLAQLEAKAEKEGDEPGSEAQQRGKARDGDDRDGSRDRAGRGRGDKADGSGKDTSVSDQPRSPQLFKSVEDALAAFGEKYGKKAAVITEEDDTKQREDARAQVLAVRVAEFRDFKSRESAAAKDQKEAEPEMTSAEAQYRKEVLKLGADMDKEQEQAFTNEASLQPRKEAYFWQDKYRPRKPRYFNRVRTGFEWNKYNQTHYDRDNPPPKTVQGYKFNIFYPDLINPDEPPTYHLSAGETPDTAILRFSARAPYEDIAFVIPNREWEMTPRRGFKCTFERGVLHLWFNFRRAFYRR